MLECVFLFITNCLHKSFGQEKISKITKPVNIMYLMVVLSMHTHTCINTQKNLFPLKSPFQQTKHIRIYLKENEWISLICVVLFHLFCGKFCLLLLLCLLFIIITCFQSAFYERKGNKTLVQIKSPESSNFSVTLVDTKLSCLNLFCVAFS